MKDRGDNEQPRQSKAVDPGGDGLPLVVGEDVEDGTAQDAWNDPELEETEEEEVLLKHRAAFQLNAHCGRRQAQLTACVAQLAACSYSVGWYLRLDGTLWFINLEGETEKGGIKWLLPTTAINSVKAP